LVTAAPGPVLSPLPPEPVIQEWVHSAFIGTDLDAHLRGAGIHPPARGWPHHGLLRLDHRIAANREVALTTMHEEFAAGRLAKDVLSESPLRRPADQRIDGSGRGRQTDAVSFRYASLLR